MTLDKRRVAVAIAGFFAFFNLYAPQAVLHELAREFQVTPATAGSIIGISTLAVAIGAPFAGMLADRYGHRRVILTAMFILVPATLLTAFSPTLHVMLVWRFIQGALIPAIFTSAVGFVAEEWTPAEAADVTGIYIFGTVLGGFSGRFLTAVAADHFGWRTGFAVLAAITLAAAFALRSWLPVRPRKTGAQRMPAFTALGHHLRNKALLATCAVGAAMLFANVATFTYVDFYLARPPFSLSTSQLGAIFVVYLFGAVAAPASGRIIRLLGRRGALALSVGLGACGIVATLSIWLPLVTAGLILFVTGVFMAQAASLGFIGQTVPYAKSTALGLYVCCYYLGGSLGAVVPGAFWNSAGWPGCVALVAGVTIAATLLALWAWRVRPGLPAI